MHATPLLDLRSTSRAPRADKSRLEFNKLAKRLRRDTGRAIQDYAMIRDGDRVMVCLSGGKDSYTMLDVLLQLQAKAPVRFELHAVNLDQKQPDFPEHILPEYLKSLGVAYTVLEQDTYSVVKRNIPEGKTMCSLCSRLRRGALYTFAAEHPGNLFPEHVLWRQALCHATKATIGRRAQCVDPPARVLPRR